MKRYTVNWSPQSLDDIRAIYNFIYEQSPKGAEEVFDTLLDLGDSLESFPERYSVELNAESTKYTFRSLPKWDYKIIYWVDHDANAVNITRITSTRQNPDSVKMI